MFQDEKEPGAMGVTRSIFVVGVASIFAFHIVMPWIKGMTTDQKTAEPTVKSESASPELDIDLLLARRALRIENQKPTP